MLALDPNGRVVRDSSAIEGLNPGGGNFGSDGRYYVGARTIMAFQSGLGATGEYVLPAGIVPLPRGFAFGRDGRLFLGSGIGRMAKATTASSHSLPRDLSRRPGW